MLVPFRSSALQNHRSIHHDVDRNSQFGLIPSDSSSSLSVVSYLEEEVQWTYVKDKKGIPIAILDVGRTHKLITPYLSGEVAEWSRRRDVDLADAMTA